MLLSLLDRSVRRPKMPWFPMWTRTTHRWKCTVTVSRQVLRREVRAYRVVRSTRILTPVSQEPSVVPVVVPAPIPPHPHFPLPQVLPPASPRSPATVRVTPMSPSYTPARAKPRTFPPSFAFSRVSEQKSARDHSVVPEFPDSDPTAGPSEGPPGLPGTEGHFPIQSQEPAPNESADGPPIPEDDLDTDSQATVDYRDSLFRTIGPRRFC